MNTRTGYDYRFRIKKHLACGDCGELGPQLLVLHDELWARLCTPPCPGLLCPECMRARWGEDFLYDDLAHVPGNLGFVMGHWPERAGEFIDQCGRLLHRRVDEMVESLRDLIPASPVDVASSNCSCAAEQ